MTTPTPAQQHIEVLRELRTESVLCDIDPVVTDALDYALAALEAVEGAVRAVPKHSALLSDPPQPFADIRLTGHEASLAGREVLIIPADAVEVSRGE